MESEPSPNVSTITYYATCDGCGKDLKRPLPATVEVVARRGDVHIKCLTCGTITATDEREAEADAGEVTR